MGGCDFVECLEKDMILKIFMCLEDPSDLVRATAVSSSWRRFVIENGLCKQLCLKLCPVLSNIVGVVQFTGKRESPDSLPHNFMVPKILERDHKACSLLALCLTSFATEDCIAFAICASSTDSYPEDSIENTLETSDDSIEEVVSYWFSKGESDPRVPEALVYNLVANVCVISEIHVLPYEANLDTGPVFSAKAVRFLMGHLKSPLQVERRAELASGQRFLDDMFAWTYTSPEFPMAQAGTLQRFRLPKPVLCVGGILKIELVGRVQKASTHLYHIGVTYVRATGRALGPAFDVDILEQTERWTLKYYPEADYCLMPK